MPVTEIGGCFSGFGDQLSSLRTTFPQHRQPTGKRILGVNPQCEEAWLQWVKGADSPGPTIDLPVRPFGYASLEGLYTRFFSPKVYV